MYEYIPFAGSGDSSTGAFVWHVILHAAKWTLLLRTNPNSRTKFHWAVTRRECVHCGNTRRTRGETRDCPSHNKWHSKEETVLQSGILWARASDCKLNIAIQAGRSIVAYHTLSQTFSLWLKCGTAERKLYFSPAYFELQLHAEVDCNNTDRKLLKFYVKLSAFQTI